MGWRGHRPSDLDTNQRLTPDRGTRLSARPYLYLLPQYLPLPLSGTCLPARRLLGFAARHQLPRASLIACRRPLPLWFAAAGSYPHEAHNQPACLARQGGVAALLFTVLSGSFPLLPMSGPLGWLSYTSFVRWGMEALFSVEYAPWYFGDPSPHPNGGCCEFKRWVRGECDGHFGGIPSSRSGVSDLLTSFGYTRWHSTVLADKGGEPDVSQLGGARPAVSYQARALGPAPALGLHRPLAGRLLFTSDYPRWLTQRIPPPRRA